MPEIQNDQFPNAQHPTGQSTIEGENTFDTYSASQEQPNTVNPAEHHGVFHDILDSKPKKITAAVLSIVAAGGLFFGGVSMGNGPSKDIKGSSATGQENPGQGQEQQPSLSPEEQSFIGAYSDRFSDPIATFNAQEAYVKQHPERAWLTIGNNDFNNYDLTQTASAPVSPFGFEIRVLKPEQKFTTQTLIDQLNVSIPEMSLFMNYLAMNPLPNQVAVIEKEYSNYAGYYNQNTQHMLDTLAEIVQKDGTNAIYEINPATTDESADPSKNSIFPVNQENGIIEAVNEKHETISSSTYGNLSITVTTFDKNNNQVVTTETIDNFGFNVTRAQIGDHDGIGIIGIGQKK